MPTSPKKPSKANQQAKSSKPSTAAGKAVAAVRKKAGAHRSKSANTTGGNVAATTEVPAGAKSAGQLPKYSSRGAVDTTTTISGRQKLPSVWSVVSRSLATIWTNRMVFLGISGVYAVLTVLLVRGFTSIGDIAGIQSLVQAGGGSTNQLTASFAVFGLLLANADEATNQAANAYQLMLVLIISLATVWALRQILAGVRGIRIRDAFYQGMYPLVPVVLVMLVVFLEFVPILIGVGLYSLVISSGIAVAAGEFVVWGIIFVALVSLSMYLLSSSIFAVYIATLPDVTPVQALRSAHDLVKHRRWQVLRKLVSFPLLLLGAAAMLIVPVLIVITPLTPFLLFALSIIALPVTHAYLYTLYRDLLA